MRPSCSEEFLKLSPIPQGASVKIFPEPLALDTQIEQARLKIVTFIFLLHISFLGSFNLNLLLCFEILWEKPFRNATPCCSCRLLPVLLLQLMLPWERDRLAPQGKFLSFSSQSQAKPLVIEKAVAFLRGCRQSWIYQIPAGVTILVSISLES